MQTYTSAATSINSGKLPAVYRKIPYYAGKVVMDYGCGRYIGHIRKSMPDQIYLPFDPYNQPHEVNLETWAMIRVAMKTVTPVTVICSNVLNVINDENEIWGIARNIWTIVRMTGGIGYITVYEGNRTGIGRKTGPDQYQRNQKLRDYLKYFPGATILNGMILVR